MTKKERVKNEIDRMIKQQSPDWDKETYNYSVMCYQSIERAIMCLMEDDENGISFSITGPLVRRLLADLPLSAITEEDFEGAEEFTANARKGDPDNCVVLVKECPRMLGLYQYTKIITNEDGTSSTEVSYRTSFRHSTTDIIAGFAFYGGQGERLVNALHPITLPYYPSLNKYQIRVAEMCEFKYLIDYTTPEGEYHRLDKLIDNHTDQEVKGIKKFFILSKLKRHLKKRKIDLYLK